MQTCLVIDESSVVRKIATRILSLSGYAVHSAETVGEAAALLGTTGKIDIVVVSATLPGSPVEDAIRLLAAHPNAGDAVVLASLVEANLGLMTRAKRAGAAGFVYRPFDRVSICGWLEAYTGRPRIAAVA